MPMLAGVCESGRRNDAHFKPVLGNESPLFYRHPRAHRTQLLRARTQSRVNLDVCKGSKRVYVLLQIDNYHRANNRVFGCGFYTDTHRQLE